MGVVHLARRGDGPRVALKVLRPHIVGDDEARRRLAREVGSLSRVHSKWVAEIVDADPWAPVPVRRDPVRARASRCTTTCTRRGRSRAPDLTWFAACLAEGVASVHAVGRAAPRREAVERADGGPHPDPHRLRAGPGRRRPEAHPHRLAARHARLPRARDPVRRGRHPGLRRALAGRPPWPSPRPAGRRSAAGRRWRSWTGSAAASTTCPGIPEPLRQLLAEALDPEPEHRPTLRRDPGLAAAAGRARPRAAAAPPPVPDR